MIQTNNTKNRGREGTILPMVANCDKKGCARTIAVRPTGIEQASQLTAGGKIPDWAADFLGSRKWSTSELRCWCPEHSIKFDVEDDLVLIEDERKQVAEFIDQVTVPNPKTGRVPYAKLYKGYQEWAKAQGQFVVGKHAFGRGLREDGLELKSASVRIKGKVTSVYCVMGIDLTDELPEPPEIRIARLEMENLELREALAHFTAQQENQNQ